MGRRLIYTERRVTLFYCSVLSTRFVVDFLFNFFYLGFSFVLSMCAKSSIPGP